MKERENAPERHSELHDPKLPQIHGQSGGNRAQERIISKGNG